MGRNLYSTFSLTALALSQQRRLNVTFERGEV